MEGIHICSLSFNHICYILVFHSYRSKTSTHIKMNMLLLKILREVWLAFSSYSCTPVLLVRYGAISGKITIIRETGRAQSDLKGRAVAPAGFRENKEGQKSAPGLRLRLGVKRQSSEYLLTQVMLKFT